MTQHRVQCFKDGHEVVLVIDGKSTVFPWELADIVASSLTANARKAEEYCKVNQIIADNALMQRAGFPLGLSDHPVIKDETIKEALYDRTLRRHLPSTRKDVANGLGNIQSKGVVGAPVLTKR